MYKTQHKLTPRKAALIGILMTLSFSAFAERQDIPVTTASIKDLMIFPSRSAPATTASLNDTNISAQITGIILKIPVIVGDTVEAGDPIAKLDCADHVLLNKQAQASLRAAQARNKFATSQSRRAEKLSKTKSIPKETLFERKADVETSSAEVARLEAAKKSTERTIKKCKIRAPFKAVVVERLASIGELAAPGTVIMRLLDRDNIEVSAMVQEQDLPSLQEADSLQFVSRNYSFPLTLRSILPLMESKLGSYEVRLTFSKQKAPPGSAGRLQWQSATPHVPSELLISRSGALGVFIENAGHAQFVPIANAQQGRPVPVSLPGDIHIIIDGRFSLIDDDTIKITQP